MGRGTGAARVFAECVRPDVRDHHRTHSEANARGYNVRAMAPCALAYQTDTWTGISIIFGEGIWVQART